MNEWFTLWVVDNAFDWIDVGVYSVLTYAA